ncbi:hypothetical protein E4U55_004730 [Claviceps digitariae]|nr:hypothetical protein E4U55_004730 [Claviceps digitariae]
MSWLDADGRLASDQPTNPGGRGRQQAPGQQAPGRQMRIVHMNSTFELKSDHDGLVFTRRGRSSHAGNTALAFWRQHRLAVCIPYRTYDGLSGIMPQVFLRSSSRDCVGTKRLARAAASMGSKLWFAERTDRSRLAN